MKNLKVAGPTIRTIKFLQGLLERQCLSPTFWLSHLPGKKAQIGTLSVSSLGGRRKIDLFAVAKVTVIQRGLFWGGEQDETKTEINNN